MPLITVRTLEGLLTPDWGIGGQALTTEAARKLSG